MRAQNLRSFVFLALFAMIATAASAMPVPLLQDLPQEPAPRCEANVADGEEAIAALDAELSGEAEGVAFAARCKSDDQCVAVCPCLPQCDNGVCANCLWCPPGS